MNQPTNGLNNRINTLKSVRELIFWFASFAICFVLLYPVTSKIEFTYLWISLLFILVSLHYFRYTLVFKEVILFRKPWFRIVFFFVNIHLFIYILFRIQNFNVIFDTYDISEFSTRIKQTMNLHQQSKLLEYLRLLLYISGISSLVFIIALNSRIIISYFQKHFKRLET